MVKLNGKTITKTGNYDMYCNIIAEIGWNHGGDMSLAEEMISAAAKCGTDYVKFQVWNEKNLKTGPWDAYRDKYKEAELTTDRIETLHSCCKDHGVKFLVSVFNASDLSVIPDYCDEIKIPSTEIDNIRLLRECKDRFSKIIVSTGASTMEEIRQAYNICEPCTILHCISMYPCPPDKANLQQIPILMKEFPDVGYSDHTIGDLAPIYAISQGCSYVEKHFTTDPSLPARDNKYSATPDILKRICDARDCIQHMTKRQELDVRVMRDQYRGRWSR